MKCLRDLGYHTATISSFGERHGCWHWYAGFNEVFNCGKRGMETAEEVVPQATDWLERRGKGGKWFLHVNLWDPHTPYRTPRSYGDPFAKEPLPAWLTAEVVERAKRLMVETGEPLAVIALECGLCDQGALSKLFRRVTGQSPAAWRKLHRN